jgi:hypothetical protein
MTVPTRNRPIPYPTAPVPYRQIERRPGPFGKLGPLNPKTDKPSYQTEKKKLKAQREAARILARLDERQAKAKARAKEKAPKKRYPRYRTDGKSPRVMTRRSTAHLTDDLLRELAEQGHSATEIAAITNVSRSTIRGRYILLGITLTKGGHTLINRSIDPDEVRAARARGETWTVIAARMGVNRDSLRHYWYKHGSDAA